MPKVETFLKQDEIVEIVRKSSDNGISRSAAIRAAVIYCLDNKEFDKWLKDNIEEFEK